MNSKIENYATQIQNTRFLCGQKTTNQNTLHNRVNKTYSKNDSSETKI